MEGRGKENKRHCRHSHGKRKQSVEEITSPPSPIVEDDEELNEVDILKIEDRPTTSCSDAKTSPVPYRKRLDNRPGSTRSVFEHIDGTRPASRRVSW
mgnify:FL=1